MYTDLRQAITVYRQGSPAFAVASLTPFSIAGPRGWLAGFELGARAVPVRDRIAAR